ncbi:hypothetical protein ACWEPC_27450 [Nonomuraea sp. NPDC004297]
MPVLRPVTVHAVRRGDGHLLVETGHGTWQAKNVISATGTWWRPYIPHRSATGRRDHHLAVDVRARTLVSPALAHAQNDRREGQA